MFVPPDVTQPPRRVRGPTYPAHKKTSVREALLDDAYRPAWWETVEHMSCNAFVLELTAVDEGPVRHGDTENEVFCLLENNPSPDWFPVGNGALEIAMESPVGKGPGGGKKPQVRNTTSKPVSEHIITLDNTAHTAHARVVPTCQRPLRAS